MEKSYVGMSNCYFCGKAGSTLLLDRRLRSTLEREVGVINMEPCSECAGYMKQGIIIMSIADDTTVEEMQGEPIIRLGKEIGAFPPNPVRTGGWAVVKEEAIMRMIDGNEKHMKFAREKRFMFITSSAWNRMGFDPAISLLTKEDVNAACKEKKCLL